jgi:hypothetical protein
MQGRSPYLLAASLRRSRRRAGPLEARPTVVRAHAHPRHLSGQPCACRPFILARAISPFPTHARPSPVQPKPSTTPTRVARPAEVAEQVDASRLGRLGGPPRSLGLGLGVVVAGRCRPGRRASVLPPHADFVVSIPACIHTRRTSLASGVKPSQVRPTGRIVTPRIFIRVARPSIVVAAGAGAGARRGAGPAVIGVT